MIVAGIDAGSRAIKAILLDANTREVVAAGICDQGVKQEALARHLLDSLIKKQGYSHNDIHRIVATGYGREMLRIADKTITEITCHARGVHHRVPEVKTLIEIGGQDSKVMRLNADGIVQDFHMNDRCAAGTGRFLEVVAARLNVELQALGEMAGKSQTPAAISSMCVVFAETEIVGLLATGTPPEDIAAGVQASIASRVASMLGRKIREPIILTGGVALITGMREALQNALGHPLRLSPDPQMSGALGAALLAAEKK